MRLVYMGSAGFAVPALEALADHVCLVVSQPDKPSGRKMELRPTPVKARALELGLPVETPRRCRSPKFIERIRALEADVLVVAAYGQILPAELLSAARQGAVNLHGSLLPRWRGAAPIQRSLAAGDMFTGVTLMQMDEGLDTGDIIAAESLAIGPHETAGEIFPRLAQTAADLAVAWMPQIAAGTHPRTPQDDEYATIAPKIGLDDARLSPEMDVWTAYNLFRGMTPAPGAWFRHRDKTVKVIECRPVPSLQVEAGTVGAVRPELFVGLREGGLCLRKVQPEGRAVMDAASFANGARLSPGDRLMSED